MKTVNENGKIVCYADDWINPIVFTGTKKQIEQRLMKLFLSKWVR